jgi:exosome complex component RRP43
MQGYIVPNLELSAMCHPQFKPGPPSEMAQSASFFIHEVIQNSNIIDPKDLCIKPGRLVWAIYIDITCLNYDGNIFDASIKALCAALKSMKLPHVEIRDNTNEEGEVMKIEENEEICVDLNNMINFKLNNEVPYSCTIAVFDGEKLLVDPTEEEEKISDTSVTVVVQVHMLEMLAFL